MRDEYWSGDRVLVPNWLFDDCHRVHDEGAYIIERDCHLRRTIGGKIQSAGVVLLLESPHKDEFRGPKGAGVLPLQNEVVRRRFEAKTPDLLRSVAERTNLDMFGRQLALVNAIQFQTSLQALMKDWSGKLMTKVRDCVWTAVFRAGGGDDMMRRLEGYEPELVLLAPTANVRKLVINKVQEADRGWASYRLNCHPSGWWSTRPQLREQVTRAQSRSRKLA